MTAVGAPADRARRWPLHPAPGSGEALSSWLGRLDGIYGLSVEQLLHHNLGPASALDSDLKAAGLDCDPPASILEALAMRTGVELSGLRLMTISGWVPGFWTPLKRRARRRSTPMFGSTRCSWLPAKPDATDFANRGAATCMAGVRGCRHGR